MSDETGGLFNGFLGDASLPHAPTGVCACPACAHSSSQGDGGPFAEQYATAPTATSYQYVAQMPLTAPAALGAVSALLVGKAWSNVSRDTGQTIVSYSFATHDSIYAYENPPAGDTATAFSQADQARTRAVLDSIEAVAKVKFVEVPDDAQQVGLLRYGYSPLLTAFAGYAYFPGPDASAGDVWLNEKYSLPDYDYYRSYLLLHETLHALGLKHPFDANNGSGAVLPTAQDVIPNTVMSYSAVPGAGSGAMSSYPSQPMALDIAALQVLYGSADTRSGNSVYDLAQAPYSNGFAVIWDAGGTDVLDASGITKTGVALDLNEGAHSRLGLAVTALSLATFTGQSYEATLSIAAGAVIENAIGTAAADELIGNPSANRLDGGAGDDILRGGAGDDVLIGGAGANTLEGGEGVDTAVYADARGNFTVSRTATGISVAETGFCTDSLVGVERIAFSDVVVAFDLDGNAGTAAKLVGVLFGAAALSDRHLVGVALQLLDGGMSSGELAQYGLEYRLGTHASGDKTVDLLFENMSGRNPTAAEHAFYLGLLEHGTYTPATLVEYAASLQENITSVGLVGLAVQGLEYTV